MKSVNFLTCLIIFLFVCLVVYLRIEFNKLNKKITREEDIDTSDLSTESEGELLYSGRINVHKLPEKPLNPFKDGVEEYERSENGWSPFNK